MLPFKLLPSRLHSTRSAASINSIRLSSSNFIHSAQRRSWQTLLSPRDFLIWMTFWVSAIIPQDVQNVISEVTALLRERHRHQEARPDDFRVRDLTEISETLASTSRLMTSLLMRVAVISLVDEGVGIMNIMLVSVTERTREIGLRMAVGARASQILRQFLVEAIIVCLCGGVVGIALGRGVSVLVTTFLLGADNPVARGRDLCHRRVGFGRNDIWVLHCVESLSLGPDRSAALRVTPSIARM